MNRWMIGLSLVSLLGCQRDPPAASQPAQPSPWQTQGSAQPQTMQPMAPAQGPGPGMAAPAPSGGDLAGTIVETMDASEYTYARIDRGGSEFWVAGPQTKLAVGSKVGPLTGQEMTNFHSDTLNRTFPSIYFINGFGTVGAAPAGAAAAAPAGGDLSGTVAETMSSGGYTYVRIDRAGKPVWLAGPETKLAVGAKLGPMTGQLMTAFRSDTLKRTFDEIYFVSALPVVGAGSGAGSGAAIPGPPNPHGAPAAPAPGVTVEKIAPAPGGITVADVFAKKDALVGKPVVVRGKVTKVNNGIMGKNWVHLRDGTGVTGTDDLLATTQSEVKLGDVVVARGTIATKQDFGAGYKYDVIVENAVLTEK